MLMKLSPGFGLFPFAQKIQTQMVSTEKLYAKAAYKMLKLTPGVNFINILRSHFLQKLIEQLISNYVWLSNFLAAKISEKSCMKLTLDD